MYILMTYWWHIDHILITYWSHIDHIMWSALVALVGEKLALGDCTKNLLLNANHKKAFHYPQELVLGAKKSSAFSSPYAKCSPRLKSSPKKKKMRKLLILLDHRRSQENMESRQNHLWYALSAPPFPPFPPKSSVFQQQKSYLQGWSQCKRQYSKDWKTSKFCGDLSVMVRAPKTSWRKSSYVLRLALYWSSMILRMGTHFFKCR